jgi:1,4-dihydroxy-2-naphthoyl-CoA hydrolase
MASNQAGSLDELIEAMPFAALLGIELDVASREEVHGRLAWDASRCTVGGVMHGGALISFADTLGGICAFLNLPEGGGTATIESKTNLFRAVRGGVVRGACRPLHRGRSTIVVQTDLYDDQDRRVAQVTQTQSILLPD